MIFHLCARSRANRVGFYTTPYIQAHILGIGSANARKRHRLTPERISSRTRSPHTWWPLDGKYLYFLSVWLSIVALIPIRWYFLWFDFLQVDEILNLRICWMRWWICESSPYGWHCLDVGLTHLASDLGQARQKYVCTVHLWAAYHTILTILRQLIFRYEDSARDPQTLVSLEIWRS